MGKTITVQELIEHMREGVVLTDAEGRIERVNGAFCRTTGYSAGEVLGKNPRLLQSGRHDRRFYEDLWSAVRKDGYWEGEIWNRRKNGEIYLEWLTVSALKVEGGAPAGFLGVFTDITQRRLREERLLLMAHTDPLTGLPNSLLFRDRLEQALARARRSRGTVAVFFLDLDDFKPVNDTLGHAAGDLLLQSLAARLTSCVRETDTVSRMGGDEFAVLLDGTTAKGAAHTAGKILTAVSEPFMLEKRPARVTASLGVALFPVHGARREFLMGMSDKAMYEAKRRGGNRFVFYTGREP
jgi:diguanylate cyclase (GGDEF)-like protein/PAS domain S-box-containing protein